ncbi:MAG TPA: hypothetical protein VMV29_04605, partial [Ktedonobacterales bacterium]|nr:hypothetical protein [Ktedonobacterales bacterium]
ADRYTRADLRAHNETETLAYGLALCAMVLLSPTVWAHHYVWLLPAAIPTLALAGRATLTATTLRQRRNAFGLLALTTFGTLALAWSLPYSWDTGLGPYHTVIDGVTVWPYALESRPLGALALAVVGAILLAGYAARDTTRRLARQTWPDATLSFDSRPSATTPPAPTPTSGQRTRQRGQRTGWAPVPARALPRIFDEDG